MELEKPFFPLSLTSRYQSPLWSRQLEAIEESGAERISWARDEIQRVVDDHQKPRMGNVHEADLLRVSGAFSMLGVTFGPYLVRHYDCTPSIFRFSGHPAYRCPIEIKKRSRGFQYQMLKYRPLPRAVVLCVEHDLVNVPEHIDVIELGFVPTYLQQL